MTSKSTESVGDLSDVSAERTYSSPFWIRLGFGISICITICGIVAVLLSLSNTRFLLPDNGTNWIVYPTTPSSIAYPVVTQSTVFSVTVPVSEKPRTAVLRIRAFQTATIVINGSERIPSIPNNSRWKDAVEFEVTEMLQVGHNTFSIDVSNPKGPPALCASIIVDGRRISTDSEWLCSLQGATNTRAIPVNERTVLRAGHLMDHPENTWTSLINNAPLLILMTAVWVVGILLCERARHRSLKWYELLKRHRGYAVLLPALIWTAIGIQNLRSLSFPFGHDVEDHVEYIRYVQDHWRIPIASDGWEMHQPPVYYVLMAALLEIGGDASSLTWNVGLVRVAGLVTGILLLYVAWLCMKRLFPKQALAAYFGICVAASIPLPLIQTHAISNDLLAALLFSGAILVSLHLTDTPSLKSCLGLGFIVGLAVLTKLTVLPPACALYIALAIRVIQTQNFTLQGMKLIGVPLVATVSVCGWYFLRNYLAFGQLIVGNFDEVSGFRWWQHPGYFTLESLTGFGTGLNKPFSTPLESSVPDGLYSTLWADAGRDVFHRPPWNYELMAIACAFALVPSLAVVIGIIATCFQWCRRGDFPSLMLLGVFSASSLGCVCYLIKLPYYSCVKSLFALPVIVPFCIFAATGLNWLAGLSRFLRLATMISTGCWASVSLLSLVIVHADPQTSNYQCRQLIASGNSTLAKSEADERIHKNPDDHDAWEIAGFSSTAGSDEALEAFRRSTLSESADCNAYQELAMLLENRGNFHEAIRLMETVIRNSPDWPGSYRCYASCMRRSGGDLNKAIRVARDGLRVSPVDAALHEEIGRLELLQGNERSALAQFQHAVRLNPGSVPSLTAIAWIHAASEDSSLRNSAAGLKNAETACSLATPNQAFRAFHALAAAEAATGDFANATSIVEQLGLRAREAQALDLLTRLEQERLLFQDGKPLRISHNSMVLP